ncbi:putative toxin-antitoxin system toxin component, PIN family [Nitrospira sp. ND1]|uniref:PIN domain-containing protein n=1 Tax=Nitrospira sp. ND1 TaxID=1658518 RepID=UPI0035163B89
MIRAVLDTNVVVSALLFSGSPSRLISAWQSGRLRPVVSAPILDELYPRPRLSKIQADEYRDTRATGRRADPLH